MPGWNVKDRLDVARVDNKVVVVLLHRQYNTCQYYTVYHLN